MKKKKCLILMFLLGILVFSLGIFIPKVSAKNLVPSDYCNHEEYVNNYSFQKNRVFNHISPYQEGILDQEFVRGRLRTTFDDFNFSIYGTYIVDSLIRIERKSGERFGVSLRAVVNIVENKIVDIEYQYDYETFYRYVVREDLEPEYTPFEGFDLCNYYGEEVTGTILQITYDSGGVRTNPSGRADEADTCSSYLFMNMIFVDYSLITNNNYIEIDYRNPISESKIIDTLGMKTDDGKILYNYEKIGSNYNENNLSEKSYIISLRALDDKKIYIKNIIVNARDYNPIRNNTIITTYYRYLTRDNIIDMSYIDIAYKDITFETNYLDTPNICGEYYFKIEIITNDNNIYKRTGKIIVNDDVSPTIIGPDVLETDTEHRMTYQEILSHYRCYDEYSNEGSSLDIAETNSPDKYYNNNYNLAGDYGIQIIASDQYDNVNTKNITLHVYNYYHNDPVISSSSELSSSSIPSSSSSSIDIPSTSTMNPTTTTNLDPSISSTKSEYVPSTSSVIPSTTSEVEPTFSSDIISTNEESIIPSTTTSSTNPTSSSSDIPSIASESQSIIPSTTSSSETIPSKSSTINNPTSSTWTPVIVPPTTTKPIESTTSSVAPTESKETTTPKTSTWIPIDYGNTTTKLDIPTTAIPSESEGSTIPKTSTWIPIDYGKSSTTKIEIPSIQSTQAKESTWVPIEYNPTTTKPNESQISSSDTNINIPTTINTSNTLDISSISSITSVSTSIDNKSYAITTTTSKKLSIDNIKKDLLINGLITDDEYDSIEIETNYFETPNKEGNYTITVFHSNGNKDSYILKVVNEKKALGNNIFIYMIIASGIVLVILIVILIVVIIRRRKHEKNN